MACNCIKESLEKLKEHKEKETERKVEDICYNNSAYIIGKGSRLTSEVSIKYVGKNKIEKVKIFHTYCPTCGVKIEDEKHD